MDGFRTHRFETPDGVSLAVHDRPGPRPDARVVVLANGLGGNLPAWRHLVEHFGPTHRIVSWDYRGLYGSSLSPVQAEGSVDVSVEAHVADALYILDQLAIERAVLVGWSMGVQLSFDVASRSPDRFEGIVALSGGYGQVFTHTVIGSAGAPFIMPGMEIMRRVLTNFGGPVARVARAPFLIRSLKALGVVAPTLDEQVFTELVAEYVRLDFGVYNRILASLHTHDVQHLLPELPMPVLVMAGDRDPMTPHAVSLRIVELLRDAELLILPGGTHYVPVEKPDAINRRIERFFRERLDHP
ncbi:MAG: alpha/beta hydrolase [Deltaproteobacteria bacterium]|nr:alpha/beta hydrolase [Deltaproteobacteria bacterium]